MNDEEIEKEIKAKGLNAPRLTPAQIESLIYAEYYHVFEGTTTTVCGLRLENGFVVVGHSASVSKENFDAELGRKIARQKAKDKIWKLEGYLLRQGLFEEPADGEQSEQAKRKDDDKRN